MPSKTTLRRATVLVAGAVILLGGAAAIAQPRNQAPAAAGFARAAERVESQGFTILEMDRDRTGFDVEALTADGRRVELDLAADGAIQRQRADD